MSTPLNHSLLLVEDMEEMRNIVRDDRKFTLLPFIMITGENASDQVRSAIAGGVTDFIIKPFTAALLERRVRYALKLDDTSTLTTTPTPRNAD